MDTQDGLPYEAENEQENKERLATDLGFLRELLSIGIECAQAFCQSPSTSFDVNEKMVVGGILAREIRRLRLITIASEKGFIENVEILSRSLFEGLLAERFILQEPIPIIECSKELRKRRNNLPAIPNSCPRATFQANLYTALRPLKMERSRSELGLSEQGEEIADQNLAEVKKSIGPDWLHVVTNHPFTYSGLKISQLAENYGLKDYHQQVYGLQSTSVHANDALQFVKCDIQGEVPSISLALCTTERRMEQLPLAMRLSAGIMGMLLRDISKSFKLHLDDRVNELGGRYKTFVQKEDE